MLKLRYREGCSWCLFTEVVRGILLARVLFGMRLDEF